MVTFCKTVIQYHNQEIDTLSFFQIVLVLHGVYVCFSGLPFNFTRGTSHGAVDASAHIRVKICADLKNKPFYLFEMGGEPNLIKELE